MPINVIKISIAVFATMVGWNILNAAESELLLVQSGKPRAVIVIGPEPSDEIWEIAKTLQEYIEKSTKAKLPVVLEPRSDMTSIHLGETPYVKRQNVRPTDIDTDGFILRGFDDGNYVIVGGSKLGTEFGVYEFLERFVGIRWLRPGEYGEDIPIMRNLAVPLAEIRQEPVFLSRDFYRSHSADEQIWAKRNRLHDRVEIGHNMEYLFPVEVFGKTNPEFYPLINGKRVIPPPAGSGRSWMWQPNFSAPGIVNAAAERISEFFEGNPEVPSFKLGLNDSQENFDQSAESKSLLTGRKNSGGYMDASDYYFTWANAVVEKVQEKYHDKWFGVLAYRSLADPPVKIGVNDRIVVYLAYDRLRWADPKLKEYDQNLIKAWQGVAKKTTGLYDYSYGLFYYVPRVYPHLMGEYLRWSADQGVRFYTGEQSPNWGEGPKTWLLAKLLWNPHQNIDNLLNEWYVRTAGKYAAPKLKEYYEIWEKFWTEKAPETSWWTGRSPYLSLWSKSYLKDIPREYIDRSSRLLNEAVELAETPEQRIRVSSLREMWESWYKPITLLYQMQEKQGYMPQTETDAVEALRETRESITIARKFQETLAAWSGEEKYRIHPFFQQMGKILARGRADTLPKFGDGGSQLWKFKPWIAKSAKIKSMLNVMAESDDFVVRDNVKALLAAADNKGISLIKNSSFEEGKGFWDLRVETSTFPDDYPFSDKKGGGIGTFAIRDINARTGKSSLEVSADRDSGTTLVKSPVFIAQTIPYEPGFYYATVSYYMPPNSSPLSSASLEIEAIDEKGLPVPTTILSPTQLTIVPGRWGQSAKVFALPPSEKAKQLRVVVKLEMLTVGGDFSQNQKLYIDDLDVVKVE